MRKSTKIFLIITICGLKVQKNGKNILKIKDIIHNESNLEVAVYCSDLFFPELVEKDGSVFISDAIQMALPLYETMRLKLGVYTQANIEAQINYTRVWDLFYDEYEHNELYIIFAKRLAFIWETYLMRMYPERQFEVVFYENPEEYELGPAVTFFEIRKP